MTSPDAGTNAAPESVLTQLRDVSSVSTIDDVMQVMQGLDNVLPATDGVKWFNLLYLYVTRAIHSAPPAGGWHDQHWVTQLDITFAQLFFTALANSYTAQAAVPSAWTALFEVRYRQDIQRVQFALAGMNAHINHDLPLAVVQTCEALQFTPARGTPQYADFEAVNGIIDDTEPKALAFLATGIAGAVAQDLNAVGRIFSNWSIDVARDTAWTNAELLWHVRDLPAVRDDLLLVMDRMTGFAGRGLLVPVV